MAAPKGNTYAESNGGGRPTDFKEEYIEQVAKLCELGATDMEIADFFEVDVRTIHRWKNTNDEFCHSIKIGKDRADERVERSLYMKATGYDYKEEQAIKIKEEQYKESVEVVEVTKHQPADTTAGIFWLKNRKKVSWQDKVHQEHSGEMTHTHRTLNDFYANTEEDSSSDAES